jgi:CheY-like chemotaxis protein
MRILIADDNQIVLRLLQASLNTSGIELIPVRRGTEALTHLQAADPPAIAIVDWQMPDMIGLDVCRRIRASQKSVRSFFILLSACSGKEDQLEAFDAGVDDFVAKPFDKDLLLARVRSAMHLMQHQQDLAAQAAAASNAATSPDGSPGSGSGAVIAKTLSALQSPDEVQALVDRTLADMGFGDPVSTRVRKETDAMRPEIDLVHFMILPEKLLWLDLLLETNLASAGALFRTFTGMDDSEVPLSDLVDSIGETLNMIQGNLKAQFKAKGAELLVPLVPQAIPSERVEARCSSTAIFSRSLHRVEGMLFRFTLFAYPCPLQRKHLGDIARADVLAEPLRPADNSDIVLINRGTLLTNRYLKKVENLAEMAPRNFTAPVFEPSPLTALLPEA